MFTKSELTGIVYHYKVQLIRTCQGKTEKEKSRECLIKRGQNYIILGYSCAKWKTQAMKFRLPPKTPFVESEEVELPALYPKDNAACKGCGATHELIIRGIIW